jgi:hypothetical protein
MRQQVGIVQAAQFGQVHAIGELAAGTGRGPQRDPGLAHAAGTGHGHQPDGAQQAVQPGQLRLAADETGDFGRQLSGTLPD